MATNPASTVSENPLAEGMARVTGIDPLSASAGTADLISYDPNLAFRAPEGDIISITGDPGTGASQAETWSHELALENLKSQQLEFEYAQQQDLLAQAQQAREFGLSQAASNLAKQSQAAQQSQWSQTYAIQKAEEQRAAALSPYQAEAARLANQSAAYALPAQQLAAQKAQQEMNAIQGITAQAQWQHGQPITQESVATYQAQLAGQQPKTATYIPQWGQPNYQTAYPTGGGYSSWIGNK